MENPGTGARAWATRECRHAGFDPRVTIQSADVYLHARLVERGLAAAMIPALSLASPRRIRVTPLGQDRVIELSVRTGSQGHPGIAAVREALQAAALGVPSDRW
jgi:DNA-binding transcriptional LysR family regulator